MAKVCFFTRTPLRQLQYEQYTYNDVIILRKLGYHIVFATNIFEIPLDCDFIYSWWASGSFYPAIIALLFRKPLYLVAGGNETNLDVSNKHQYLYGYRSYPLFKRICIRFALSVATKILPVSYFLLRSLVELDPSLESKSIVVYNCVDSTAFYTKSIPFLVRSHNEKRIACISSLDSKSLIIKRIPQLIEAFTLARNVNKDLHLVIIGRVPIDDPSISDLLSNIPAGSFSLFKNLPKEKVVETLLTCDVYCQVSIVETFGLAAMEAAFLGLPLILSDCGALPEIFGDYAAFTSSPFTVESLASLFLEKLPIDSLYPSKRSELLARFSLDVRLNHLLKILP